MGLQRVGHDWTANFPFFRKGLAAPTLKHFLSVNRLPVHMLVTAFCTSPKNPQVWPVQAELVSFSGCQWSDPRWWSQPISRHNQMSEVRSQAPGIRAFVRSRFLTSDLNHHREGSYIYVLQVVQTVPNPPAVQETCFQPCVGKIPWRREWQPTPVFLPGEFPGQRSLAAYNLWGLWGRGTRLSH